MTMMTTTDTSDTIMGRLIRRARTRAAANGQRGMTLLEIMIVLAILALVMGFLVGPAVFKAFTKGKDKVARIAVTQLANEAYPRWAADNPSKTCPGALTELSDYTNKSDVKDPWGSDMIMLCGDKAQGIRGGFGVMSLGEDKQEGTADDVKSWE